MSKVAILAGDGIGPEVMAQAEKVLTTVAEKFNFEYQLPVTMMLAVAPLIITAKPYHKAPLKVVSKLMQYYLAQLAAQSGANLPPTEQPERASLLGLRGHFDLFCNMRPAHCKVRCHTFHHYVLIFLKPVLIF